MYIINRIKEIRLEKGITQKDLAERIFKSEDTVKSYESGRISLNLSTLIDICDALDVTIASILIEDQNDILKLVKDYYNLEDKIDHNLEKDFDMVMKGFVDRYKK